MLGILLSEAIARTTPKDMETLISKNAGLLPHHGSPSLPLSRTSTTSPLLSIGVEG